MTHNTQQPGLRSRLTFGSLKRCWRRKQPRWSMDVSWFLCHPQPTASFTQSRFQRPLSGMPKLPRRFSLIAIIRPSTFQTFCPHSNPTPSSCTSTGMKCFQYPSSRWDHPPPFSVLLVGFHRCSRATPPILTTAWLSGGQKPGKIQWFEVE